MADRTREIRFLRNQARRMREIAEQFPSAISEELLEIAEDMERRADDLESPQRGGG